MKRITVVLTLLFFSFFAFGQMTYTVNTTDDVDDGVCDAVHCSLREAINEANGDGVASNIHFGIAGTGPFVIHPTAAYLITVDSLIIDGSTQPNWTYGDIILDGTLNAIPNGLRIQSSETDIKALQIEGFTEAAINIGNSSNVYKNNYIGENNKENIIISNAIGIKLENTEKNFVQYNYIGTNHLFDVGLENTTAGIFLEDGQVINYLRYNNIAGHPKDIYVNNSKININYNDMNIDDTGNNPVFNSQGVSIELEDCFDTNVSNNTIAFKDTAINIIDNGIPSGAYGSVLYPNSLYCSGGITLSTPTANGGIQPPIITNASVSGVSGTTNYPSSYVCVYKRDNSLCPTNITCDGKEYIGCLYASGNSWTLNTFSTSLQVGDEVVATEFKSGYGTSEFSTCETVYLGSVNTYLVNTTDDTDDGMCDGVHCSLREAINAANTDGIASNIHFDIAGTAPFSIQPLSTLPILSESYTFIDATTQPNWTIGDIVLDGINLSNAIGFSLGESYAYPPTSNFELYGFQIQNFGNGVVVYVSNVTIGGIGKENIIQNNSNGINAGGDFEYIDNTLISSNEITDNTTGISLYYSNGCQIIENEIANNTTGIYLDSDAFLTKNSFYCNNTALGFGYSLIGYDATLLPSMITSIDDTGISGTAIVADTIEIFKHENIGCAVECQGKIYLGQAITDNIGNWSFNTTISKQDTLVFFRTNSNAITQYLGCAMIPVHVVNTTDDIDDGVCDATHCSLREAINASNGDGLDSQIEFDIAGTAPYIIQPLTNLPRIVHPVIIDGTTQPNYQIGDIVLDGLNNPVYTGLHFSGEEDYSSANYTVYNASGSEVYGLTIKNFNGQGLLINDDYAYSVIEDIQIGALGKENQIYSCYNGIETSYTKNINIEYNYIGTNNTFTNGLGNSSVGVLVQSDSSFIRHNYTVENNVDIQISGKDTEVSYNTINTDLSGNAVFDTLGTGISLINTLRGNVHHNTVAFKQNGINLNAYNASFIDNAIYENTMYCTGGIELNSPSVNNGIQSPEIIEATICSIDGTATPLAIIHLYQVDNSQCSTNVACNGTYYLGMTATDSNGDWLFPSPSTIQVDDEVVATANLQGTSEFSNCLPIQLCEINYTVNTTNDIDDGLCDATHCSLREAIIASNTDGTPSEIHFDINGNAPFSININSVLPKIMDDYLTIDATSQPNWSLGDIIINNLGGTSYYGLEILASYIDIYGFQIQNFGQSAIHLGDGNTLVNEIAIGEKDLGIGNILISNQKGITSDNFQKLSIQHNYIGVDENFTTGLSNTQSGIELINGGGSDNVIESNFIAGHNIDILATTSVLTITNNTINTDNTKTLSFGSSGKGIVLNACNNTEINSNDIYFKPIAIEIQETSGSSIENTISQNAIQCGTINFGASTVNQGITAPVITHANTYIIKGTAGVNEIIEVFKNVDTTCGGICAGTEYLGIVSTDNTGSWAFSTPSSLSINDKIVATTTDASGNTSIYSNCGTIVSGGTQTYYVNTTDDNDDGVCDSNHCSFREALNTANSDGSKSYIYFEICGSAPFNMQHNSAFPDITEPHLVIDGSYDYCALSSFNAIGAIVFNKDIGMSTSSYFPKILASNTEIYGLTIKNFSYGLEIGDGLTPIANITIGDELGKQNIIIENSSRGIYVRNFSDVWIKYNYIGTDDSFGQNLENQWDGIYLLNGFGNNNKIEYNYVVGHSTEIEAINTVVNISNNTINTDPTKSINYSSSWVGILLEDSNDCIISQNTIAYKSRAVEIEDNFGASADRNTITQNEMICSVINLDTPTANEGIQKPTIIQADIFTISGTAGSNETIELFLSDNNACSTCSGSIFLGSVTSDFAGNWSIVAPNILSIADNVTATTTDSNGNTSAFSVCKTVERGIASTYIVTTTDNVDDGNCTTSHCSLIEAVNAANSDGTPSDIHFDITTGSAPFVVSPNGAFTLSEKGTTIDASSQPAWSLGDIVLDGGQARFVVNASNIEFYGLKFQNVGQPIRALGNFSDLTIGKSGKGNVFYYSVANNTTGLYIQDRRNINIQYNYIGIDENFNVPSTLSQRLIYLVRGEQEVNISNNYFSHSTGEDLYIHTTDYVEIKNNKFGFDNQGNLIGDGAGNAVYINNSKNIEISNNDIGAYTYGIQVYGTESSDNLFTRNDFYCNSSDAIKYSSTNSIAAPTITYATNYGIQGTALPDAVVEIYKNDNTACTNNFTCEGEYLGKTLTNGLGEWAYATPVSLQIGDNIGVVVFDSKLGLGSFPDGNTSAFSSCSVLVSGGTLQSSPYIVNTDNDLDDGFCSTGHCSLREAIKAANTDGVASEIHFDISGTAPHIISYGSYTNTITADSLLIDASTQPNWTLGDIVLDGTNYPGTNGLRISASDIEVYGFQIQNFSSHALLISGSNSWQSTFDASNITIGENGKENIFVSCHSGVYASLYDSIRITNNYFGTDLIDTDLGNTWYGVYLAGGIDCLVENNTFAYNRTGVYVLKNGNNNPLPERHTISSNEFFCNSSSGIDIREGNNGILPPIINYVDGDNISGTSLPNAIVEIYDNMICVSDPIQGNTLIGSSIADALGNWFFPTPSNLEPGNQITALTTDIDGNSSEFSLGFVILPTDCIFAGNLQLNTDPCNDNGIFIDFKDLTPSSQVHPLSCEGVGYPNTLVDAWYKITVPSTGNCLLRTNGNNTIAPILEVFTGDCNNLSQVQCAAIDTFPFAVALSNYAPGVELYISVWDRDNTIVNSGGDAFLSLTAHELSANASEWEICDQANNTFGNPTNLAQQEALNYILEFNENTPQDSVLTWQNNALALGDSLVDECVCGGRILQLWGVDNLVDLEGRRCAAESRSRVDTTNYNYIFEAIDFQVNSYAVGRQDLVDVDMNEDGDFVMAWVDTDRKHNYARVYNSSGNPISSEIPLGLTNKEQLSASIAMKEDGTFMVAWHEKDISNSNALSNVFIRNFNADGQFQAFPQEISLAAAANISAAPDTLSKYGYGVLPSIDTDANGNYVVAWTVDSDIYFQLYDNTDNFVGTIQTVNDSINSTSSPNIDLSMNNNGDFAIAWNGGNNLDIWVQRFDNIGNKIGSTFRANDATNNNQSHPSLFLEDTGKLTVTWQSLGSGYFNEIYWNQFDILNNTIFSLDKRANDIQTEDQVSPDVVVFDNGEIAITWSSYHEHAATSTDFNIYGRLYHSDGTAYESEEFLVNTIDPMTTDFKQSIPKLASNGEGLLINAWVDRNSDDNYEGIFAQRYEVCSSGGTITDYYPIGTATPSSLLGDTLLYAVTPYVAPSSSAANVRVAIIDTGIDDNHPFLSDAIWTNQEAVDSDNCVLGDAIGYDFVNETGEPTDLPQDGHGTKVNGIVARDFDSNIDLDIMNLKFHELDKGKVFDAVCAIYYAVDNGAEVMNLSWGFEASENPAILRDALLYASDNDVLIVTTAGNTSKNNDMINKYPANLDIPNMIVVTSYTLDNGDVRLSNYASYGKNNVDIAAHGFVQTTTEGDTLTLSAGTSLAAPAITRTAATIKGLYPLLSAADIKNCILSTAAYQTNLDTLVASHGILDHPAALACAQLKYNDYCSPIDLYISVLQNIDSTYRSNEFIGSNAILTNIVDVEYLAADSILLDADFCVPLGAEFLADIEDCDPLNNFTGSENEAIFRIQEHSPYSGKIKAKFQAKAGEEVTIRFLDTNKKLLAEWQADIPTDGQFEKIVDVHRLPAGLYYVEYACGDLLVEKAVQVD